MFKGKPALLLLLTMLSPAESEKGEARICIDSPSGGSLVVQLALLKLWTDPSAILKDWRTKNTTRELINCSSTELSGLSSHVDIHASGLKTVAGPPGGPAMRVPISGLLKSSA